MSSEDVLAAVWDVLMSGREYAMFAVILSLMKMSLATSVRMAIVMSVSMQES